MARWAIVNLDRGEIGGKRILKSSTYDLMWKPYFGAEFCSGSAKCTKPGSSVGMSWFLENRNGQSIVTHSGGDDGFVSLIIMVPDRKFAFVMMSNSDSAGIKFLKQLASEALALAK